MEINYQSSAKQIIRKNQSKHFRLAQSQTNVSNDCGETQKLDTSGILMHVRKYSPMKMFPVLHCH